jgi:hypothetical protein
MTKENAWGLFSAALFFESTGESQCLVVGAGWYVALALFFEYDT